MSSVRQFLLSLLLLAAGVAGFASVSEETRTLLAGAGIDVSFLARAAPKPEAAPAPPAPAGVVTAVVGEALAATRLSTIGTGRALRSVTLLAEVGGLVTGIGFAPGEAVAAGAVLLTLDATAEEIAKDRAEAALAAAREDLERLATLASRNAASQVSLDEARRRVTIAELDLRAAEFALARRTVRAPFAGIVGLTDVEVGDVIGTDTALATLDDRSRIVIDLNLPERFASLVGPGQPLRATTPARPGETFAGVIAAIDSQVDATSRTLRVRAAIPNEGDRLRPGASFAVEIAFPGAAHPALPALAVQWGAQGTHVWVVREGRAVREPVTIVERTGERVLVTGAVAPGERVVVEGVLRLRPGAAVAEAAPAAPGG